MTTRSDVRDFTALVASLREVSTHLREVTEILRTVGVAVAPVPPPRKLVGWKEILKVSALHGGPTSETRLRNACRARGAPVYVWRGMAAVADEQKFIVWLEGLRVPIQLEPLGASGKSWRRGVNRAKKKAKAT